MGPFADNSSRFSLFFSRRLTIQTHAEQALMPSRRGYIPLQAIEVVADEEQKPIRALDSWFSPALSGLLQLHVLPQLKLLQLHALEVWNLVSVLLSVCTGTFSEALVLPAEGHMQSN